MSNLSPKVQRWLMFIMPPLSLLVCCIVMVPRQNHLRQLGKDIRETDKQIAIYLEKREAIKGLPPDPKIATLPMNREEQSNFLRGLAEVCTHTQNTIMTVASLAPPTLDQYVASLKSSKSGSKNKKKDEAVGALPPGVLEVKSVITFEGTYTSLRAFLAALKESRRMIALTDCKITIGKDGYPRLLTSVTVARYVDAPPEYLEAEPKPSETADSGAGKAAS